jgi:hypothetical protein
VNFIKLVSLFHRLYLAISAHLYSLMSNKRPGNNYKQRKISVTGLTCLRGENRHKRHNYTLVVKTIKSLSFDFSLNSSVSPVKNNQIRINEIQRRQ